ncbi:helix-turn-helix domain-containing protein [Spirosoma endophyticum]|uniref:AraC-type DNA-binding protein n=1 Tax=Spirosoma endophyticum TaxID=662367 RepID=A0A1I2DUP3_9BACT|nr:AraC family transcriptional regulator [Spirosoma endophyticum]SFE84404.1 AraC-type DNA-binding protein [Spirosoma endophyticum]
MENSLDNPFILALTARNLTVEIHQHSAYQIVLSNDESFDSTLNGQLHRAIRGFLIKPQVTHLCIAENGTLSVLNIEPYSNVGLALSGRFADDQDCLIFHSKEDVRQFFQLDTSPFTIHTIISALLATVVTTPYDERVTSMVNYIRTHYFERDISPQTFADMVFLSPSRLAALFKEQTGSSLSRYLLWTRLRQAIYTILSQKDQALTDVAYDTGFYDLPQFNKYMHDMFGMPPIALKQNSDLIQVY